MRAIATPTLAIPAPTRAQQPAPGPGQPGQGQERSLPPITLDLRDAPIRQALEQVFNSARVDYAIDNAVAAAIFWILLPIGSVDYLAFVGIYAPSVVAGLLSHVPGGVGVFEGSLSALLRGAEPAALAAAFLGYRLFFFLIPLLVAGLALAFDGLRRRR